VAIDGTVPASGCLAPRLDLLLANCEACSAAGTPPLCFGQATGVSGLLLTQRATLSRALGLTLACRPKRNPPWLLFRFGPGEHNYLQTRASSRNPSVWTTRPRPVMRAFRSSLDRAAVDSYWQAAQHSCLAALSSHFGAHTTVCLSRWERDG
jgi:hypothetical protein